MILGAGECGARAAFALRENGYEGSIALVGNERHLPYERPPLSKSTLIEEPGHKLVASKEKYAEAGIDLRLGTIVDAVSPEQGFIVLAGGERIAFDKLLLATGASPRRLSESATPKGHIKYLRTFDDAIDIRSRLGSGRRLAIVGAGFIGLELAATARAMCTEVTVIEAQPRVLMRGVPVEIAEVIRLRHAAAGVDLRCGTSISSIKEDDTKATVNLANGTAIAVDTVVVGIGALPNTDLAEAAGIKTENGIAVDETLRTSAANVFAAGDCCSFPLPLYGGRRVRLEAWRNAQDQGTLAARNMLGGHETISSVPYFWSDQYDLTLQVVGLAEGASTVVERKVDAEAFILFHLKVDGTLLAASGIGRGNAVGRDIKLAERMIAGRMRVDAKALASPDVRLRSLLAA